MPVTGGPEVETREAWGWDEGWQAVLRGSDGAAAPAQPARVIAHHRDRWVLQTADGPRPARLTGSGLRGPLPATGDWVVAEPGHGPQDPLSIRCVLPRRSAVTRGSAGSAGGEQVLAANVDRLWIVHGLDSLPNPRRLERYLAIGWESGAVPEVVLTKSDLATDADESLRRVGDVAMGVRVWIVSVSDPEAMAALRDSLEPGSTIALLGPSGAGKSTLVNRLAGTEVVRTGEVRARDAKGRHTTTTRELIRLPGGALLLDTPGLRELRVLTLAHGLGRAFPDIEELAERCRFRDCAHRTEPGCAVLIAVEAGSLAADRLESFRKLEAEAAWERRRADPRAMAESLAEHKTALKTLKYHPKYQRDD